MASGPELSGVGLSEAGPSGVLAGLVPAGGGRLAVDVRFEVDHAGDRDGLADAGLRGVDGVGDLGGRVVVLDGDLGGDEEFLGAEVEGAHVDDAGDGVAVDERGLDLLDVVDARGLAQEQRLGLGGQHDRDGDEQDADAQGADAVPEAVVGGEGEAGAGEREDETDQRAEVLEEDDGQLGCLGAADELGPG